MWPCSLRSAYELQAHWSRFLRTNRPSVYIQNTFQTFSLFILCDGEDSRPCPFGGRPCKLSRFVLFPDPSSSVSPPLSHLGSFSSSGSSSSCSCADCSASPLRPREAPCPGPSLPPSLIRQPLSPLHPLLGSPITSSSPLLSSPGLSRSPSRKFSSQASVS